MVAIIGTKQRHQAAGIRDDNRFATRLHINSRLSAKIGQLAP
jgi:hypothetical protein